MSDDEAEPPRISCGEVYEAIKNLVMSTTVRDRYGFQKDQPSVAAVPDWKILDAMNWPIRTLRELTIDDLPAIFAATGHDIATVADWLVGASLEISLLFPDPRWASLTRNEKYQLIMRGTRLVHAVAADDALLAAAKNEMQELDVADWLGA